MFDIGFSELVVIALVALLVVGPERLPKLARTLGHLMGRAQRYAATLKAEVDREMKLEELKKLQEQFRQAESDARHVILEEKQQVEAGVSSLTRESAAHSELPAGPKPPAV